jgi:hypothetical protein
MRPSLRFGRSSPPSPETEIAGLPFPGNPAISPFPETRGFPSPPGGEFGFVRYSLTAKLLQKLFLNLIELSLIIFIHYLWGLSLRRSMPTLNIHPSLFNIINVTFNFFDICLQGVGKKTGLPFPGNPAISSFPETRGFPSPPRGGFGFIKGRLL